jgi:phage terminase Nu1 subunit (DNA packaging protein)
MGVPKNVRAAPLAKATIERARLAAAQADLAEQKLAHQRGALLDARTVRAEWSAILRGVRAGVLAAPSRVAARLPHLSAHDVATIDGELRAVLAELGEGCDLSN